LPPSREPAAERWTADAKLLLFLLFCYSRTPGKSPPPASQRAIISDTVTMIAKPRCTVILPTFNRIATLPRAVASVLAQDMADFELLVVDDASTDGTDRWLAQQSDARIRVLRSDRNVGPSQARNLGLGAARADVTAFLDSDDEYLSRRLSVPLKTFAAEPDVVCTLSSSEKHDTDRTRIVLQPDVKLIPGAFEWALMCGLIGVESSSITVRTAVAREAGEFCITLSRDEDGEFLVRVARLGAGRLLPDVLWRKFWSKDGLSAGRTTGAGLVSYVSQRPEFIHRFHKLGSYRATGTLVADLRRRDIAAFFADLRRFRAVGLVKGGLLRLWRSHREVRKYRRRMANREALASLQGPPDSWN
jgi:glycosyltransferase involved in cell wall biosynthesis